MSNTKDTYWIISKLTDTTRGPMKTIYGSFLDRQEVLDIFRDMLEPYGIDADRLDPMIEAKTYTFERPDRNLTVVIERYN